MFNAKTFEKFIDIEECKYLVEFAKNSNLWESGGGNGFWDNRVINYYAVLLVDPKAAKILMDSNNRCREIINKNYSLSENVYSDTLQIVRWFPGMEQPPHADDMSNTDVQGFDHRVFGSIIYLNDDYSGGKTYYPNFNFEIIPEPGKLAIHPGDPEHLHGVTKINDNIRYTISSFWTFKKEFSHEWLIN